MEGRGKRKREGGREGGRGKWEEVGRTGRKREEQRGREEDRKGRERVNVSTSVHCGTQQVFLSQSRSFMPPPPHSTSQPSHLLKGHSRANNRFTIDREDMITNTQLSFLYKKER